MTYGPPDKLPPSFVPYKERAIAEGNTKFPGDNSVAPNTFSHCLFQFTYLWLNNNFGFWVKPVSVNNFNVDCWYWNSKFWTYGYIPLKDIECFMCY